MLTNCLAACAHLTITVSEIERDIGRKSSFFHTPLHSTPLLEGFPCADLREILRVPPQMPNVRNRVKIFPKRLTVWVGNTNVTGRRQTTDRQTTDTIAVPLAEHNVVTFDWKRRAGLTVWFCMEYSHYKQQCIRHCMYSLYVLFVPVLLLLLLILFLLYIFPFIVLCVCLYFIITAALCVLINEWMNEYCHVP